ITAWNIDNGTQIKDFYAGSVVRVLKSLEIFASGLGNGVIKVWDYDSFSLLYNLNGHRSAIHSIDYFPNNFLCSGDENGTIFIWDLTKQLKHTQLIHNGSVNSIILINSNTFASAASNSIKLWSIESFNNTYTIENAHSTEIIGLRYFSNNLFSISSDGILKSWNNSVFKFQINTNCSVFSFDMDQNGNLACGCTNGYIKIYSTHLDSFLLINSLYINKGVSSLCLLETGFLVTGGINGTMNLWNYNTSLNVLAYKSNSGTVTSLKYFGDRFLLSGSTGGFIRVWDRDNGTVIKFFNASSYVYVLKFIDRTKQTTTIGTGRPFISTTFSSFTTDYTVSGILNNKNSLLFDSKIIHIESLNFNDLVKILTSRFDFNDCLLNCSNHGECIYDNLLDKFFCNCQENYYGSSCKLNVKPCSSNPCLNNGICLNVLTNNIFNYECQCSNQFYSGRNCEFRKDVCFNETCSNKGNCYDSNHTAKCKCFSMYSGDKCEIESRDLKEIKRTIKATSILAIIIIVCLYGLLIILDVFCKSKSKRKNKKNRK
ncbi:unnamed protein product, partial [Brachionus calyciflorus]